jgi:dTDP-4-dehydrorhamnose 3,5-epimerase
MVFRETALAGAYLIEPERQEDERGFFARTFCEREFAARGLVSTFVQWSISHNPRKGTLRGMHYQAAPHEETKLVRCTAGAIYDVVIDLRKNSPTYRRWASAELSAENRLLLYVPEGFAHGFVTLRDATEVAYHISAFYQPETARGVRWDDSAFRVAWPEGEKILSERDRNYPDFSQ